MNTGYCVADLFAELKDFFSTGDGTFHFEATHHERNLPEGPDDLKLLTFVTLGIGFFIWWHQAVISAL